MKPTKLYTIVLGACLAGYIWIAFQAHIPTEDVGLCLIKKVTDIPCPACGSSRSILSIVHGEFRQALLWNPLGFLSLSIMNIAPIWIVADLLTKRKTFHKSYLSIEIYFKKPIIYIPSILLVLSLWMWNILKGL